MNREPVAPVVLLSQSDARQLLAAEGYSDLGMFAEAEEEICRIDARAYALPQTLFLQLRIYAGLRNWKTMQELAQKMALREPDNPHWTICWAYAVRRAQSIHAARKILLGALEAHPEEPSFHYNLSCYESRLRHFKQAQRHLARAIQLDSRFRLIAGDDKDLEPLWAELERPREGSV
jgi:tetratricopeptide (TPR) repeat protein